MGKPSIVIADSDYNYIIPLQLKFVEEFYDTINLEVICDREYLGEFFSAPQKVDILIISEDIYDPGFQRSNIGNVFVLTEEREDSSNDPSGLNVTRIHKYTSIKEIFSEIIARSAEILNVDVGVKKEPSIVLVCSACGGTGKTTVALGLSTCLSKSYKKVLYINAGRLQSFQRLLGNPGPISAPDVYISLAIKSDDAYHLVKHTIRQETFSYLPPFKASLMSLGLGYGIYASLALSAKNSGDYDFIVVDADSAFDENLAELINIASKVIVVTEQNSNSVYSTGCFISNLNIVDPEKFIFICNNFDKDAYNALISLQMPAKISINEFVDHFYRYDQMKCEDYAKDGGLQRAAFLIL